MQKPIRYKIGPKGIAMKPLTKSQKDAAEKYNKREKKPVKKTPVKVEPKKTPTKKKTYMHDVLATIDNQGKKK